MASSPEHEVALLDAKRLELQRDLDVLDKQRAIVLARSAPIRRIVDDILAHIFEIGAAEDILFPENVSSVSRHWRNVILQTPAAWSNLILDRRAFPQSNLQIFMRRSEVFLARSQSAPLTVVLDLLPLPFDTDVHQLMALLHGHLGRCAIFQMQIDTSWLSAIARPLSTLGPTLREIDIRTSHSNVNPIALSLTEVQGCLPLLESLTLSNLPPSSLPATRFPALKYLRLHGVQWQFGNDGSQEWPWSGTASLLESSPNLQSLELSRMEFILDGNELLTPRKIELKGLRSLTFDCMETRSVAIVLEALDAPDLKSLKMRYDPNKIGDHWCMHRLEAPCIASIEELEVEGYAIYGGNLPWFLRTLAMVPLLTKLTVASPPMFLDSRFFEIMSTGPNWLVPRLRDLRLIACANLHGQDLLRLLRARSMHITSGGITPIRTLTLKMPPWNTFEEEILSLLKLNVEELNHSLIEPYSGDRSFAPHSPLFRPLTPPPLPLHLADPAWDAPPQLGTPFGVPFHPEDTVQLPIRHVGHSAMVPPSASDVSTSRSSARSSRTNLLSSVRIQDITTVLLVASATAITTSLACYHLFMRPIKA